MITRNSAEALTSRSVNLAAIPPQYRHKFAGFIARLPDDFYSSRSAMLRAFLVSPVFEEVMKLPYEEIAHICDCGPTLVHKVFAAAKVGGEVRGRGRPSLLNEESIRILTSWVRERTEQMD